MGIVKLPHMSMYWETATRYPPVADTMARYRFKNIRLFFQVNDSPKAVRKGNAGYDPLFKVRPLVVKCMISKFIAEKEPPSGLILGFGADKVLRLVEHLPKNQNVKIFFDNFYSSFHLVENPKQMGIESVWDSEIRTKA